MFRIIEYKSDIHFNPFQPSYVAESFTFILISFVLGVEFSKFFQKIKLYIDAFHLQLVIDYKKNPVDFCVCFILKVLNSILSLSSFGHFWSLPSVFPFTKTFLSFIHFRQRNVFYDTMLCCLTKEITRKQKRL